MRARGIAGASVDDVMEAAGLTRGGFYAHFKDKTALAREVLELAFDRAFTRWLGEAPTKDRALWRRKAVHRYLSEAHLDNPGEGCAAQTLGAEVARADPELRAAMGPQIERMLGGIASRLDADPQAGRRSAIVLLSTCVGAMTLARSVGSRALAREILSVARDALAPEQPAVGPGE